MKIKITSDSTCDLSQELIEKYDIGIIPLIVIKDGVEHRDGVSIVPADIFSHVAKGGDLCSTAALGVGEYQEYFTPFASNYDGVLHINTSEAVSVALISNYRYHRKRHAGEGEALTEASFDLNGFIEQNEGHEYPRWAPWVRLEVRDARGNLAWTRAYFLDELKGKKA